MNFIDLMSKRSKQRQTRKWSKYNEFASIWRQNEQNDELRRKTFKTTQNYESDQIIMTSIWRPNDKKCWVTSQTIQNR